MTVWRQGGAPTQSVNYLNDVDFTRGPQEGTPLYNVHFGPGPAPNSVLRNEGLADFSNTLIRDLEVADLDGRGRKLR